MYAEELQHVPMAAESALDLLVGGIDDMAVWAANVAAHRAVDGRRAARQSPPRRRRAAAAADADADAWVPTPHRLRPWRATRPS